MPAAECVAIEQGKNDTAVGASTLQVNNVAIISGIILSPMRGGKGFADGETENSDRPGFNPRQATSTASSLMASI